MDLKISFWGVRGSRPVPGIHTNEYGGNTSCVQMEAGGVNLIFDGGTGIVALGDRLLAEERTEGHIFLSHTHWDHIQGLPFFKPFFHKAFKYKIYGESKEGKRVAEIVKGQMLEPYFPLKMDGLGGEPEFLDIGPGDRIELAPCLRVTAFAMDHPGGSLAYRVDFDGGVAGSDSRGRSAGSSGPVSAVYATDTETLQGSDRERFLEFIQGAGLLIYDTFFTQEEYEKILPGKNGKKWGHSTVEEAVALARDGGVGQLVLFHHKDNRNDEEMREIEAWAKEGFENTLAAKEGLVLRLGKGHSPAGSQGNEGGPNE